MRASPSPNSGRRSLSRCHIYLVSAIIFSTWSINFYFIYREEWQDSAPPQVRVQEDQRRQKEKEGRDIGLIHGVQGLEEKGSDGPVDSAGEPDIWRSAAATDWTTKVGESELAERHLHAATKGRGFHERCTNEEEVKSYFYVLSFITKANV